MHRRLALILVGFTLVLCVAGCRNREAAAKEDVLVFWHTQSDRNAAALREIIEAYNASGPAMAVREEYVGDYDTLYKKTITALAARRPPAVVAVPRSQAERCLPSGAVPRTACAGRGTTPRPRRDGRRQSAPPARRWSGR